jgi:hypothetical protein
MKPEFPAIFAQLRSILQKHAARLTVSADAADHYCLDVDYSPKFKKGFPVAWVKIGKAYVSYHFMPVYMFPQLVAGLSKELRARMQGKSCFNFARIDEPLFTELEALTARCVPGSRAAAEAIAATRS